MFTILTNIRALELCESRGGRPGLLCESRGGRPGLPVPNKPDSFCGRKAALK